MSIVLSEPHLAIIVPAFNEEPRILPTLKRIQEYFSSQEYSWTVVVVSDGSTDQTDEIVRKFASGDTRFRLIGYNPNRGKGYAVRTGMLETQAEWLLFCDADLATPIEEVEKLLVKAEEGFPIAIGSRPLKDSKLEIRQPWHREMLGRTFNKAVQLLAIKGVMDTQCGFKLFSYEACQQVFSRCKLDGFGFDFEALMIARDLDYSIAEVPIRWMHQEGSKVVLMRDGPRMLRDLVWLRLRGKKKRMESRAL